MIDDWRKWLGSETFQLASTTIDGQFPEGENPEGASDMSGNVWEWMDSWYDEEQIHRVLRGGSWDPDRRFVRCAFRDRFTPDYFDDSLGFRVVSPGSDSDS
jgi:formylglycine-generating enzyme required for sulfatase activity